MLQKNKLETSRFANLIMLLSLKKMEQCLGDGTYAILGKVQEKVILCKEEAIAFLTANQRATLGFSIAGDGLDKIQIDEARFLIKETKPVIHIKAFSFGVCSLGKLLEDYHKEDAISFGIKISYPLLYSEDGKVKKTRDHFEENSVFKQMRMFSRKQTVPIKLKLKEKIIQTPFRVGKDSIETAKDAVKKIEGLEIYGY